uniref:Photosystem II reaction center protein M n=1 Tax=Goodyera procera TaxID=798536 RepID=A0A0X9PBN2_9ASPA|nr:photosystem II protein M [Goodyera procera]AMA07045.1 photosystem II protein M [Goodyera procera]
MEVNILAFIATALFILVPTAFLLRIDVKTVSQNKEFEFFLSLRSLEDFIPFASLEQLRTFLSMIEEMKGFKLYLR